MGEGEGRGGRKRKRGESGSGSGGEEGRRQGEELGLGHFFFHFKRRAQFCIVGLYRLGNSWRLGFAGLPQTPMALREFTAFPRPPAGG